MKITKKIIKEIIYNEISSDYNGPVDQLSLKIMHAIYKQSGRDPNLFLDDDLFQISLHKDITIEDIFTINSKSRYRSMLNNMLVGNIIDVPIKPSSEIIASFAELAVTRSKHM